jgi:hypothetical protein
MTNKPFFYIPFKGNIYGLKISVFEENIYFNLHKDIDECILYDCNYFGNEFPYRL